MSHIVTSRFVKCIQSLKECGVINSFRSFALSIDIHPQSLHEMLKQNRNVTIDIIAKVVERFHLNAQYLYTGDGPMFVNQDLAVPAHQPGPIGYVPVAAQAGYGGQLHDPILCEEMPSFSLPGYDYNTGVHRCFDISGDSMEPTLYSGDKVVCSLLSQENWISKLKDGYVYIIVTQDSVYVKRVKNHLSKSAQLELISDNTYYQPFMVDGEEIQEIWNVEVTISAFNPSPNNIKQGFFDQVESLKSIVANQTETIKTLNGTIETLIKSTRR